MKKVFENIYLIDSFFSISNQYLITFKDFCVLIDTGLKGNSANVLSSIRSLGYKPLDLKYILITHADGDHVGSLAALKKKTNAVVYSSDIEKIAIENGESSRPLKLKGIKKLLFNRLTSLFKADSAEIDQILSPGQILPEINQLRVIDSKGHTPGHLSFYLESVKTLFSGDSIEIKGSLLKPSSGLNCWDETKATESYNRQLELSPNHICGGHGFWKNV
jgi:glyoxylase-like metal-dependent hydrolase (beta-lactamase superfamily II)